MIDARSCVLISGFRVIGQARCTRTRSVRLFWPKLKYLCVVLVLKDFDRDLGFMLRQLLPRAAEIVLLLVKTGSRRFCEDHSGRIQGLSSLQDQAGGIFARKGEPR